MYNKKCAFIFLLINSTMHLMESDETEKITVIAQLTSNDIENARDDFKKFVTSYQKEATTLPFGSKNVLKLLHLFNVAKHINIQSLDQTIENNKNFYDIDNYQQQQDAIDQLGKDSIDLTVINIFYNWAMQNKSINLLRNNPKQMRHKARCAYLNVSITERYEKINQQFSDLQLSQEEKFNITALHLFSVFILKKGKNYFKQKKQHNQLVALLDE